MESNNCVMDTNAVSALKEDEIELELGLSIGGSCKKLEKFVRVQNGGHSKYFYDSVDVGLKEKHPSCTRSSVALSFIGDDTEQEMDPKTKREIHALRRQETKKKRQEKQLKKGSSKGKNGVVFNGDNDGILLRENAFQTNDRDFDAEDQLECKKSKIQDTASDHIYKKNVNLNLSFPVQYPYPYSHPNRPLHYGRPTNGLMYPCANVNVMPCGFMGGVGFGKERNMVQPVGRYGFVPYQEVSDPNHNLGSGCDWEHNGSKDGGSRKAGSNGPSICSSSAGSDHGSSSHEGGGNGDRRSHSSHSAQEQPQLNGSKAKDTKGQSEHSATSHLLESAVVNEVSNLVEKMIPSNTAQSSPTRPKEEAKSVTGPDPVDRHLSTTENATSGPLKESNGDTDEPPKPQIQNHSAPSLPYMPCVSTTGNGPNGKTIHGFLYRYTKTEVGIVCVCHGSSFSPAEFVQHAGGTDVLHPLRHITVISSAF